MNLKLIQRKITYTAGFGFFVVCSLILRHLPDPVLYEFAKALAVAAYALGRPFRKVALQNLRSAYGSTMTRAHMQKIVLKCFISIVKSAVEVVSIAGKTPAFIKSRYVLVDKRHLDRACAKGKGVILVSAHFGNFPMMVVRLACEGYTAGAIMRPLKDERFERFLAAERDRFNIHTIKSLPRKECVVTTIRSLRNNEVIFLPLDQNFGSGGVFVDFFGRKAATATGPVVLAQRTGAAIVPCFIIRQEDDRHTIVFEPEMPLTQGGTEEESIRINVQRLTSVIESYVRQYPAEWSWIHRRWKARPRAKR
ncbi:MAG TPA: lysophospholipid acyltransferase family protein [Candidatus Omnitrophota bacterium]|nr:lysophospholipid acyltransferase family protein [Candidatus Omnitrophota bacterium]